MSTVQEPKEFEELLECADSCLLTAKRQGRNQVVLYTTANSA